MRRISITAWFYSNVPYADSSDEPAHGNWEGDLASREGSFPMMHWMFLEWTFLTICHIQSLASSGIGHPSILTEDLDVETKRLSISQDEHLLRLKTPSACNWSIHSRCGEAKLTGIFSINFHFSSCVEFMIPRVNVLQKYLMDTH